jgi:hypothetical protein
LNFFAFLSVQKVHYPADAEQRDDKVGETLQAITQSLVVSLLRYDPKDSGGHQREQYRNFKVRQI